MNFRTTSFSSSAQALKYSAQYKQSILKFQEQISSGIRLNRASDDPVAFRQVTSLRVRLQELRTEGLSISDSETKLNTSVSQLVDTHSLIVRAKTLTQQGIQATSQTERNALAVEIDGLLLSLKGITRTKSAGSYLYSGTRTDQSPYEFGEPQVAGGTLHVEYLGTPENSRAYIGDSITVETTFAGDQIFGNSDRGTALIFGLSGAKIGNGTDNMVGRATMQVRHSTTTYVGASGIAPGTQSASQDTILGTLGQNQLVVRDTSGTGTSGTISLNDGTVVPWSNTDTNLKVISNTGEEIYVDMSAITPGFDNTVDFTSDGTLSVDGGLTTVPIDFSTSQTLIDSTTTTQTHIDTSKLQRVGDDSLEFPGTSDIFQVLYELAQDLRGTRKLGSQETTESLDRRLGELDQLGDHVLEVVGQQSASLQTLDSLDFRVQDLKLEVETKLNGLQATDIPDAVLRLQNDQTLLEFTYAVTAQIASTSLIDFLR